MTFKPFDNNDFRQALKYYFGESDQLPNGVGDDASEGTVGRHDDGNTASAIGRWDTSRVTDMGATFKNRRTFDQAVGGWNVSKVVNFSDMFNGAQTFNQPIGMWDTSGAMTMEQMFQGAVKFNQYIGDWDVSGVTNFSQMFFIASSFNQDISRWDVRNGKRFQFMFANAIRFNCDIRTWRVTEAANVISMFVSATTLQSSYSGLSEFANTPTPGFFNHKRPTRRAAPRFAMPSRAHVIGRELPPVGRTMSMRMSSSVGLNQMRFQMRKLRG